MAGFDIGWAYTLATMAGSLYISTTGESRKAWAFYLCAACIGIVYFTTTGELSQLVLLVYFAAMNSLAIVRVHLKLKHHLTLKQAFSMLFKRRRPVKEG